MTNWIKYTLIGAIFIFFTVVVTFISVKHVTNITATQEVDVALKSTEVGTAREMATNALDRQALVANLILEITQAHKEQGQDISIDYVFLDKNGNKTQDDSQIESVQFRVNLLDEDGEIESSSTQRVGLKLLEDN